MTTGKPGRDPAQGSLLHRPPQYPRRTLSARPALHGPLSSKIQKTAPFPRDGKGRQPELPALPPADWVMTLGTSVSLSLPVHGPQAHTSQGQHTRHHVLISRTRLWPTGSSDATPALVSHVWARRSQQWFSASSEEPSATSGPQPPQSAGAHPQAHLTHSG